MARLHRAGRVRWWLVAVLALLALSVPPAVWFLCFRATPTATALLQVSMRQDTYMSNPPPSDSSGIQKEFEIYKSTQRGWITSPFVLTTALRKPEVSSLAIIQREKPNEIAWIQDHLEVSFPGDAEVMQVDLTGGDSEEAVILLRGRRRLSQRDRQRRTGRAEPQVFRGLPSLPRQGRRNAKEERGALQAGRGTGNARRRDALIAAEGRPRRDECPTGRSCSKPAPTYGG